MHGRLIDDESEQIKSEGKKDQHLHVLRFVKPIFDFRKRFRKAVFTHDRSPSREFGDMPPLLFQNIIETYICQCFSLSKKRFDRGRTMLYNKTDTAGAGQSKRNERDGREDAQSQRHYYFIQ